MEIARWCFECEKMLITKWEINSFQNHVFVGVKQILTDLSTASSNRLAGDLWNFWLLRDVLNHHGFSGFAPFERSFENLLLTVTDHLLFIWLPICFCSTYFDKFFFQSMEEVNEDNNDYEKYSCGRSKNNNKRVYLFLTYCGHTLLVPIEIAVKASFVQHLSLLKYFLCLPEVEYQPPSFVVDFKEVFFKPHSKISQCYWKGNSHRNSKARNLEKNSFLKLRPNDWNSLILLPDF